jgi:hypothetical protein
MSFDVHKFPQHICTLIESIQDDKWIDALDWADPKGAYLADFVQSLITMQKDSSGSSDNSKMVMLSEKAIALLSEKDTVNALSKKAKKTFDKALQEARASGLEIVKPAQVDTGEKEEGITKAGKTESKTFTFDDLPKNVLVKIGQLLGESPEEQKQYLEAVLPARRMGFQIRCETQFSESELTKLIRSIDLDDVSQITEHAQKILHIIGPKVTELKLNSRHLSQEGIELLVKTFPNIKTLDISSCTFEEGACQDLSKLKRLEELSIGRVWPDALEEILEALSRIPSLQKLSIDDAELTPIAITYIGHCSQLKKLLIDVAEGFEDSDLSPLKNLKNLNQLQILNCIGVGEEGANEALTGMCNLTALKIVSCPDWKPNKNIQSLQSLKNLVIYDCTKVDDQSLDHLKFLIHLQTLSLLKCPSITEKSIESIAGLNSLTELILPDAVLLTNESLRTISSHLKNLKKLRCALPDITHSKWELYELQTALSQLPYLKELILLPPALHLEDLKELATLKNLETLILKGQLRYINLEDFASLAKSPKLKSLILNMTQFSLEMESLSSLLPKISIGIELE